MSEIIEFSFPSSTGNNTIFARKFIPDTPPRGIVQIAHGISEHIGRYEGFMEFLARNGFIAVGNDHLGHGRTVTEPADKGFFSENDGWKYVVDDMDKLHDMVCEDYPELPYIFFGHSMGSFLTRTYLFRFPDKPDLAILCGTGHQAKPAVKAGLALAEAAVKTSGPRAVGDKLNSVAFGSYNNKYSEIRTAYDWISSDPDEVDRYIADTECGAIPTVGLFRDMMNGIDLITTPANIAKMNKELPVLFISGWADPVGEYGKGVRRAFKAFCNAGMKHVHIKLYPGDRHELLNEVNKAEVMNDILNWIEQKLAK